MNKKQTKQQQQQQQQQHFQAIHGYQNISEYSLHTSFVQFKYLGHFAWNNCFHLNGLSSHFEQKY